MADTESFPGYDMEVETLTPRLSTPAPSVPSMTPKRFANSGSGQTLDVAKAHRIIKAFTDDPSWLADPRTSGAANSVFSAASRVIGMNIQLERANAQAEAARARNSTAGMVGKSLLKLAEGGGEGAKWAAQWYAPGNDGKAKYEDPSTWADILSGYEKHAAKASEFQSPTGKELADRMELVKKFGADSSQVKKFDELSSQSITPSTLEKEEEYRQRLIDDGAPQDQIDRVTRRLDRFSTQAKAQSSAGKELADRMDLEKRFGADSPQVKKFDELATKAASPTNLGKLLAERRAAPESEKGYYDQAIGHLGQKMGISIQYDDQGRPIINYGPQKTSIGDPSVATQSMAQRKLLKYEAASELINDLQNKMQSGDVGLAGVLGEYVGDRLLPQLGVDTFKGQRADVRSTMIAARESLLREISDDTRFSNLDREEISKALPSSGVFESLPNALQRLSTVRNILNARGRTYAEGLGLQRPEWSLTADEIKALYDQHQATGGKEGLSLERARSLLERFHNFKP